jgi:tetratricopeptide (TPR) repeat protein
VSARLVRALCLTVAWCCVGMAPLAVAQDMPVAAADRAHAALARTVASLPRADVGTWTDWRTRPMPEAYLAALEAYRIDDLVLAWRFAFDCLEAEPDHPASLSLVGGLAFRFRRHQDAIDAFERFLQHAPDEVARTRHLGHAYHGLGRHADARAHYARVLAALDVTPSAAREARFGLALAAYRVGDVESARTELDRVLADTPDDIEALTWRATIAFEDEELGPAQALAERAATLAPFDPKPLFLLARVLSEQLVELELASPLGAPPSGSESPAAAEAEAERVRVLAEHTTKLEATRARFALLAAADARSRELEATLTLDAQDVGARMELARLRAAIGDGSGALRQAALLARVGPARHDAQIVVLEVLAAHGRPASADAHAQLLEATFGRDPMAAESNRAAIEVFEALERFHAQRGDVQARLRTGARAAELRQQR